MKVLLKFNLPEDREEYENAMNGSKYASQLEEVTQRIFRPARKHGYSDRKIQELIDKLDRLADKEDGITEADQLNDKFSAGATELISLLEEKFIEIRREDE